MSTKTGSKEVKPLNEFNVSESDAELDVKQLLQIIDDLEADKESLKDKKKEHDFYWLCGCILLGNVVLYKALDSFPVFFLFFIVQLFALTAYAKKQGVDWVEDALGRAQKWISENIKSISNS